MLDKKVHTGVLKSAFVVTKDFDHGFDNDGDTIEVTEWTNMLGFNIDLNRTSPAGKNLGGTVRLQLSYGDYEAIKACVEAIEKIKYKVI